MPPGCGDTSVVFTRDSISYSGKLTLWTTDGAAGGAMPVSPEPVADGPISCSPDGNRVLVTVSRDQTTDLYEQPIGGGPRRQLTFDAASETDGAWSPDGTLIAFASDRSGSFEIWVMRADGGSPTQLTDTRGDARAPRWSPDAGRLVFDLRTTDDGVWRLDGAAITRALEQRRSSN